MALEIIKPLIESGLLNEDTQRAINEAWDSKLVEAREEIRAELREEFAQRYEHDKDIMVEALDKMLTSHLQDEITEFQSERRAINEDRVRQQVQLRETARKFNDFLVTKLAEEIKELRGDRKVQLEAREKLEQFMIHVLAKEVTEFAQDKQAVVEAKVKLVREGREQIEQMKRKFVAENAKRVGAIVGEHLKGEMKQLKEDIKLARENEFGRRIFESFASEFSVTHLNEKAETRKLMKQLEEAKVQLEESRQLTEKTKQLVESKDREVRMIRESTQREKTIEELLSTLNTEKAGVMRDLLESVQTPKLKAAFDKYLPAVLNGGAKEQPAKRAVLSEGVTEVTGNKTAKVEAKSDDDTNNVIELKRLAGL